MPVPLRLALGVKTDPVEYRYSYPWLFRLLAAEKVRYVQLGTFFELYQLPDEYFHRLREQAEAAGVEIRSIFTAHRELGGFFIDEPGWEKTARRNFERLIQVGGILGAQCVGSNPGAVYRDRPEGKQRGVERYLKHMKELMAVAREHGVRWLTIEPMSCLAEPPTLPGEIAAMAEELDAHHAKHRQTTARVGFCTDVAHGYVDAEGHVQFDHFRLLQSALPHLVELHLKNTDARYCSTFGFGDEERARGIVQIEPLRQLLLDSANRIPVELLVGYLEIGGPKLGRDYSDPLLAEQLRSSLGYLRRVWPTDHATSSAGPFRAEVAANKPAGVPSARAPATGAPAAESAGGNQGGDIHPVRVAPSIMCADLCRLEESVRQLEAAGAELLHIDVADGHFVPNLLLGPDLVEQLHARSGLPLDVHLMVDNPGQYLERLASAGAAMVAVHAEAALHLDRLLEQIRDLGMQAGAALNPATPLDALLYVLERLDFVLLMTVNPGYAGQKMVAGALRKIADCRSLLDEHGCGVPIMVDGNVSFENIPAMVAAGADILVAGTSSWFHRGGTLQENVARAREAVSSGLRQRRQRTR